MEERKLKMFYTSDIHGYIYPTDYRSPEEKDIGLLKCANRFHKDGNTLIIDGGDILQGSPLADFCHDELGKAGEFADIMNSCGYDYVTLGNHDFNYGTGHLPAGWQTRLPDFRRKYAAEISLLRIPMPILLLL